MDVVTKLEDAVARGAAPFLSVAAEQCGLNPQTVARWYHWGSQGRTEYVQFFKIVARIRADWKVDMQSKMTMATKDDKDKIENIKFLLKCADRDLFDLGKGIVLEKKDLKEPGRSLQPQTSPEDLEAALKELGGPGKETVQ
jgi:hypothetical protein